MTDIDIGKVDLTVTGPGQDIDAALIALDETVIDNIETRLEPETLHHYYFRLFADGRVCFGSEGWGGPKWNASEMRRSADDKAVISFYVYAWGSADPAIEALSERFPSLRFEIATIHWWKRDEVEAPEPRALRRGALAAARAALR